MWTASSRIYHQKCNHAAIIHRRNTCRLNVHLELEGQFTGMTFLSTEDGARDTLSDGFFDLIVTSDSRYESCYWFAVEIINAQEKSSRRSKYGTLGISAAEDNS